MLTRHILYFLLFFLPLLAIPVGINFETVKVLMAEIAIALLVLTWINQLQKQDFKKFKKTSVLLVCGIFLLSSLSLILNLNLNSLFGNIFRLQGNFLLYLLLIFSIISSSIKIYPIPNLIYQIPLVLIFIFTLIMGPNLSGRFIGSLGDPNSLASTAIFLFPFVWFNQKNKKVLWLMLILIILFLSQSASGILGLILQLTFIFLIYKVNLSLPKSLLICLILLALSYSLPFVEGGGWYENRAEIWKTSFYTALHSPLLGYGFGNTESAIHNISVVLNNNVQYQIVDSSHNLFLDFWIQGGLISLIIFISLITFAFINLNRKKSYLEISLLIGLLTVTSFNPPSVTTLISLWWVLGQGYFEMT